MKKIEEMLADVRADQAQRQKLEQEQEQKKRDLQEAVNLAEKELQEALARQDQEAYHAAEGRLSYAREVLRTFEAANPWWTQEEATKIVAEAYKAYLNESKEKYKEVFDLLGQLDALLTEIQHIGHGGHTIDHIITQHTKINHRYSFATIRERFPQEFGNKVARMAGTTYIPYTWF